MFPRLWKKVSTKWHIFSFTLNGQEVKAKRKAVQNVKFSRRDLSINSQEADSGLRWISVLNNVADQLYYPCEHVAWASDAKLIRTPSDRWWLLSTLLWGASLLLGTLR